MGVFTIPPGIPFLPALADALADGSLLGRRLDGTEEAVVYLPTRRAARAFSEILAERGGGRARLLPRIVPLGDADRAEFELAAGSVEPAFEGGALLAPPIAPLERRLILARLIQGWAGTVDRALLRLDPETPFLVPSSPADAVALAADLEGLMDSLAIEEVPWTEIAEAVETEFSHYFRLTLDFVRIAVESWPRILAERQASDPAARRDALIRAEAARLLRDRPHAPVVAAGSTGSMPATAALLAAIARLPNGAVVLPGLDRDLDDASWRKIGLTRDDGEPVHGHPQAMLRRLVEDHLKVPRDDVATLGAEPPAARARVKVLAEALRPAETTDAWAAFDPAEHAILTAQGLAGVAVVEAADEREEALAVAVALREVLEEPGRIAALVTPDRSLALRVAAELRRWDVEVEDSAGVPLSDTPAGRLARLAADAAALDFEPARVLALIAHPLLRLGLPRSHVERAAAALEIGVLRGPEPRPGLDGLAQALAVRRAEFSRHTPRPRRRLDACDWDAAADLLTRLSAAFDGFPPAAGECDLVATAAAHRLTFARLIDAGDEPADDDSVEPLEALFDDLAAADGGGGVHGRFADYPAFFAGLARQRTVPPAHEGHARVKILGLLEARLLAFDRVVLGGLDEGVWPPRAETDAFLNRPMRARLGLSPPEQRIGQTAHDFVQLLGAPDAVITRAAKRDGSPMVPSRFLQRLEAFAGEAAWAAVTTRGDRYLGLARALDRPEAGEALRRPAPKPDPALHPFPRALSVTEVETLVRDPYAIYAKHILKLDALDPVAAAPGAAERGTLLHDILGRFAMDYPKALPADALERLLQRGADAFRPTEEAYPELYAEWWPRFERLAAAFVGWDEGRRAAAAEVFAERSGVLAIPLPNGETFSLRARADRIEARPDGSFAVVDFKTGQPPSPKEVFAGFSPQLTLEAAMLMAGGFKDIPAAKETPELLYVHIAGGREPLKLRAVETPKDDGRSVPQVVAEHRRRLEGLLARYVSGEAGYLSRPFPKYARKYADYDHLARVKEWSLGGANGEEAET
ncbi:MAG TPA: double-strand break repair protein AddB [Beijerinckiaceae bacterium]